MAKVLKILRMMTALATLLLLGCLGWHCVDIYNQGINADVLASVFSYDQVAERLSGLAVPAVSYIILIIITILISKRCSLPKQRVKNTIVYSHKEACAAGNASGSNNMLRWCVLIAGILLILWGIANGSLYDVLVKSINICTECIGLG